MNNYNQNNIFNGKNYAYNIQSLISQKNYNAPNEDSIIEIDELSTDEKTKFSNNIKDIGKSVVIRTSDNQSQFLNQSENLENYDNNETTKICYKFIPKFEQQVAENKIKENIGESKFKNNKITNDNLNENKILKSEISNKTNLEEETCSNNLNNLCNSNYDEDEDKKAEEKYFWLAAYDKLIKTKNLNKIFNFFVEDLNAEMETSTNNTDKNNLNNNTNIINNLTTNITNQPSHNDSNYQLNNQSNFHNNSQNISNLNEMKDHSIILKDFEIYFDPNLVWSRPFIREKKVRLN
jgi:hypothetical protein